MNLLQKVEKQHIKKLIEGKSIPEFRAGDSVRVFVRVVEGNRERTQKFEGVVLGFKKRGINSSFRVRKISNGEGVERVFPLYSPNITVEVVRHGRVRRAKLYYLRELTGKKARIAERSRGDLAKPYITVEDVEAELSKSAVAPKKKTGNAKAEEKAAAKPEAESKKSADDKAEVVADSKVEEPAAAKAEEAAPKK